MGIALVHSADPPGLGGTRARCDDLPMSSGRPRTAWRALALLAVLVALSGVAPADASPAFPPQPVGRVGPGVQLVTHGVRCTAGFVFRDRSGRTYLGYVARCASPAGLRAVNGCRQRSWPLGTRVRVASNAVGTRRGRTLARGVLRYSSWLAMRRARIHARRVCRNNDFALVQLRGSVGRIARTLDYWDGPDLLGSLPGAGQQLLGCTAQVVSGVRTLVPGGLRIRRAWHWGAAVRPAPGLRSDVGAGFVDSLGRAVGILLAGHEGRRTRVASLPRALGFARHHGMPGLRLVPGSTPFHGSAVV